MFLIFLIVLKKSVLEVVSRLSLKILRSFVLKFIFINFARCQIKIIDRVNFDDHFTVSLILNYCSTLFRSSICHKKLLT